ncbi:hypothetical protein ACFL2J_07440, partial [Candidatus Omnitrophota bacterium]
FSNSTTCSNKAIAVIARRKEEKDLAAEIKSLYSLSKGYYRDKNYSRAIALFEQVVELEKESSVLYTSYAKKYIQKANKRMQMAKNGIPQETRESKIKQTQANDDELLDEVIDIAKETSGYKMGTETREASAYSPPSPALLIHQKLEMPVNMNFQDVDVAYILDYLAEATGANIVMSNAVTESEHKVSIKVKDMTLQEAIRYVLKSVGLTHRLDKNVIWVATPDEIQNEEMETKIFTLKKGQGTFTEFSSPSTGGVGLGSAAGISSQMNIKDLVEKAVSWPSGSKVVLDERLSSLIVTNTPYNLELIERILVKIDVEPTQVLIETRFLEVTVTDLSELGIDWQLDSDLPFDSAGRGMVQGLNSGSGSSFTDTSRSTEGFNLTYQGVLTKPQFQFVLHALDESQKVKTLSAPRVTTLNNQMATMKIVDEWIYPTRYEFQIVQNDANGDGDFNDAGETQYKNVPSDFVKRDVGILLRVTPSVGINDETITLTLIPEVSEGTAGYFSYSGEVSLPLFTSRNLSTSVVVNNGDTVVLGGLIKESQTKVETKVPILGDLPWVGALFKKETDTTVRKNLLIFVTASILSSSGNKVVRNKAAQPAAL